MKKSVCIPLIAFIISLQVTAQNFVGLHKDKIVQLLEETQKNFKLNTSVVNKSYNYLKYEDKITEQTLLFFLNEDDYCTYVRLMSDYGNFINAIDSLNNIYARKSKNVWTYKDKGEVYIVCLEKGEWFFTISTKKEKNSILKLKSCGSN